MSTDITLEMDQETLERFLENNSECLKKYLKANDQDLKPIIGMDSRLTWGTWKGDNDHSIKSVSFLGVL